MKKRRTKAQKIKAKGRQKLAQPVGRRDLPVNQAAVAIPPMSQAEPFQETRDETGAAAAAATRQYVIRDLGKTVLLSGLIIALEAAIYWWWR